MMGQDSGPALALLSMEPVRGFQSLVALLKTLWEFLPMSLMPSLSANSSHLVSFFCGGGGCNGFGCDGERL